MWRLVLTLSLLYWSCEAAVTCKDRNNVAVDWYILYKAPNGVTYTYIDSNSMTNENDISDPNGLMSHTLHPLFQNTNPNFGYLSYNDQHSKCKKGAVMDLNVSAEVYNSNDDVGHSKGVVMVEKGGTGVWLLHSTPHFPMDKDKNNFWPPNGNANGQTFICVTFKYDEFQKIGLHMQYIGACVFDKNIPNNFYQELKDAGNGVKKKPVTQLVGLTSNGGKTFNSIAKPQGKDAEKGDLYVTISENVKSDLKVQTWGRQVGRDKSFCRGNYKVWNVMEVRVGTNTWTRSHDHSKWCVAEDQNKQWTCIADVNRAETQYKRRGGAICMEDGRINGIFKQFITRYEKCENFMDMIYSMAQQGLEFVKLFAKLAI